MQQRQLGLHAIDSRPGYTAGEITYTLTMKHPTIVLPASFGVDCGSGDTIAACATTRAWIPE